MTFFALAFPLAAPFWALMILAPKWRWTPRVMASPWVPLLPLVCYFALVLPHLGEWGRAMLLMYFEGRAVGVSPWIVSPILLLTIFLSPFGLVAFLVVRAVRIRSLA